MTNRKEPDVSEPFSSPFSTNVSICHATLLASIVFDISS